MTTTSNPVDIMKANQITNPVFKSDELATVHEFLNDFVNAVTEERIPFDILPRRRLVFFEYIRRVTIDKDKSDPEKFRPNCLSAYVEKSCDPHDKIH